MPHDDDEPLSDDDVYEALWEARQALGSRPGATTRGNTTIEAARRSLDLLQFGLLKAMEDAGDDNEAIIPRGPSPRR